MTDTTPKQPRGRFLRSVVRGIAHLALWVFRELEEHPDLRRRVAIAILNLAQLKVSGRL